MKAICALKEMTLAFCNQITNSQHKIPYAMLYMAKIMKSALHKRFPHIPDKEILKVSFFNSSTLQNYLCTAFREL